MRLGSTPDSMIDETKAAKVGVGHSRLSPAYNFAVTIFRGWRR
jgi:hypothetical protein